MYICTWIAQDIHNFPPSGLIIHKEERSEKVHVHLQKRKQKEIFVCLSVHSYLWGHIIADALCQQSCILNLNMYVKWMTLTFPQLCNYYNFK